MKSIANRFFLFAAAALSLGTAAYGQNILTANVPFAFRGPAGTTSAGHYKILIVNHGSGYLAEIRDRVTGRGVISIASRVDTKTGTPIAPRLVFRCTEADCQLSEIWTRDHGFSVPVKRVHDPEYVASIPLVAAGD
jgi:hypothetical protein